MARWSGSRVGKNYGARMSKIRCPCHHCFFCQQFDDLYNPSRSWTRPRNDFDSSPGRNVPSGLSISSKQAIFCGPSHMYAMVSSSSNGGSHVAFLNETVSSTRPVGTVGVQGAAEAVGVQGAAEAVGVQGAAGAVGVQGAAEAVGVQGAAGWRGLVGVVGRSRARCSMWRMAATLPWRVHHMYALMLRVSSSGVFRHTTWLGSARASTSRMIAAVSLRHAAV